MKKLALFMAIATLSTAAASAQTVVNNPDNTSYFGLRASYDLTCPGDVKVGDVKTDGFKKGSGASLGLVYNQPIVANLYVEPGLTVYYNTTGMKISVIDNNQISGVDHSSMRNFGLRVPVMLGYHFDFLPSLSMSVFVGPELQVGLVNDQYVTAHVGGVKLHSANSAYGDKALFPMHRTDCKLKCGVGFNINQNYYVGLEGAVGLTNLAKDSNVHYKENRFSVSLGYNF